MSDGEGADALVLHDVSCRLGGRSVVDGVSFAAPRGRVTALVGPSGCGKSTLLRMIAGIERPSAGRIEIDGLPVATPERQVPPERRRVGLVFQDFALFPHLTARDNVMFGVAGLRRPEREAVAERLLATLRLAHLAEQRPGTLSGGEQQRLALARALAPGPRLLLLDEPFSSLDRRLRDEVRGETLRVLAEAGVTTLLVTHDPEEALAVGGHLVLLARGRVIQAGDAATLYDRPVSLEAAGALSDVNVVPGRFEGGCLRTALGDFAVPEDLAAATGPGDAGLRPEWLTVSREGAGLACRIVQRALRGPLVLLTAVAEELDTPLRILVPAGHDVETERVRVGVVEGKAMVFRGRPAE